MTAGVVVVVSPLALFVVFPLSGELLDSVQALVKYAEDGRLAVAYAHLDEWDLANERFQRAIKAKPHLMDLYLVFAKALEEKGKDDEAAKLYRTVIDRDKRNLTAYNQLGVIYAKEERYSEAEELWMKAIEIDPRSEGVINNLKRIAGIKGRILEEAPKR